MRLNPGFTLTGIEVAADAVHAQKHVHQLHAGPFPWHIQPRPTHHLLYSNGRFFYAHAATELGVVFLRKPAVVHGNAHVKVHRVQHGSKGLFDLGESLRATPSQFVDFALNLTMELQKKVPTHVPIRALQFFSFDGCVLNQLRLDAPRQAVFGPFCPTARPRAFDGKNCRHASCAVKRRMEQTQHIVDGGQHGPAPS